MSPLQVIRVLGPIDAHSVWRDPLLRWMPGMALALGALLRFGVPPLTAWLAEGYEFDLVPYYPLLMSFVLLTMPIIVGMVIGFLLLDERDDNTLAALQVTPLSLRGYLIYRLSLPVVLSVLLSVVVFWIADLGNIDTGRLLLAAIGAALLAPLFALYLASFAANKVQGFALTKANGFITMPPLIAWFVDTPWQYLFGIMPTYWPVKALWQLSEGIDHYAPSLVIGLAFELLLLWLLVQRFEHVMRR